MSAKHARIDAATESSKWDLVLTRTFDAPRELVFQVWTDPKHLALWWGPDGFTNPVCEVDARVGGAIRIDMRAPSGAVYPMSGTFEEISEPERLVFISSALDANGKSMFDILNTVLFEEQHGKTVLTLQARVMKATVEAPQYLKGMEAGWTQSLGRLGDYLRSIRAKDGGQEIRDLIAQQYSAICRKDVAGIMANYADDAVIFNVRPPFQIAGCSEWEQVWQASLAHFPASFAMEMKNLRVTVSGHLAVAHYWYRFTGLPGKPSWIRNTAIYQRAGSDWRMVHEHHSVPFDPETSKAVFEFE
jgi:uncharacterized protein YndB with AHSA1/START domain/ketosteroid isomerase-like protein